MRPSVLHVTQTTHGGVPRCVLDLTGDQVGRGWHVAVASPDTDDVPAQVRLVGAAHELWRATREPRVDLVREASALTRIVSRCNPDLVHLHSSKAGLVGRLVVRGRRPTIFQPNGWSFLAAATPPARAGTRLWERAGARWASVLLCVSERERADGVAARIAANWRVEPNAVDLTRFRPADGRARDMARRRLQLDDRPTVVCVGRLTRQKGQDVLLDAWPVIAERVTGARLVLVGDVPPYGPIDVMGSADILVTGHRADVHEWLAASDVVALPSRWEGMSYVMLEAMATARPVVAADVGGAREALDEHDGRRAGALVPAEDPRALAAALVERLLDSETAEREGAEGARRAAADHDLTRWCDAVAALTLDTIGASVGQ
ncbi:MAG: glycosyltransferase family 1 protein [Acidimicrobiales bacterium]|nr:glycosyltransferase family 1 protein [Acidimicrobiales bacterium]